MQEKEEIILKTTSKDCGHVEDLMLIQWNKFVPLYVSHKFLKPFYRRFKKSY